ncbi:hypothetical protein ACFLTH_12655 [Bacteroidota bacterium]
MNKIFIYVFAVFLLSMFASAADVGVIVLLADGTEYTDCVEITNGDSAYDAFQETSLDMKWQNQGFGYFLEEVEGVASGDIADHYWSFWHINSAEDDFEFGIVGASDYTINDDGKVIGSSYTVFDASFNPVTPPPFYEYDNLCPLEISSVKAYVDGDKESLSDGDSVEVKPGSNLEIVVKIENNHDNADLEDVEIEVIIEDIDDGDNLEEDDNGVDINDGDSEELSVGFKIPIDADDDNYNMILRVTGEGNIIYERVLNFEVEVDKNKHEISARISEEETATCGRTILFDMKLNNVGKDDEEGTIRVYNAELGIDTSRTFEIDEADSDSREFTLRIPSDAKGQYLLKTSVSYSGETDEYATYLNVNCKEEIKQDSSKINVQQVSGNSLDDLTANSVRDEENDDSSGLNGYIVLLILGNIILVGILIFLFRR